MEAHHFIRSLQISDSFFPVGAFAYSDGMETAATNGLIPDADALRQWMRHFLDAVFVPCDGLAVVKCMRALRAGDSAALALIDEELTAIRPAAAVRAASTGVGRRLISLYAAICGEAFPGPGQSLSHGNAAAAYALVFFHAGIGEREAALAYGYNRLTGMVSAALRLISIGQNQGQTLLTETMERLPGAVDRILQTADEPLRSFSPLLDIQQMNHTYVYSRLFRS